MPYESMPDLRELLREAGVTDRWDAAQVVESLAKTPDNAPERVKRSAAFMVAICDLMDSDDPESAFRDVLREMQHAAVEFGVNWTDEDRMGWADVHRERARAKVPGPL